MAEYKDIIVQREGAIMILSLNRPEKLNALNWRILKEGAEAMEQASADDSVKAVILTGVGRGFCTGADLGPALPGDEPEPKMDRRLKTTPFRGFGKFSMALHDSPKPVIAAVNGYAVGAGFAMALACDIRIASEQAKFSSIFVKRGLMPDSGITYYLPHLIGPGRAFELMYTGDIIDAEQAERWGIVNRVVPHDQLLPAAMELADKIAKGPSIPVELIKQAVHHGQNSDLMSQLAFEGWCQERAHASEDFHEGRAAFRERRDPVFRGE